jgi:hypothetical protein
VNLQATSTIRPEYGRPAAPEKRLRLPRKPEGQEDCHDLGLFASYGKPLSVPQGIIGLMTRFGMKVDLLIPKVTD